MQIKKNEWRGTGVSTKALNGAPAPSTQVGAPELLLRQCPAAAETPLTVIDAFGTCIWVKDERGRMGLGSFKALGAAYVIAHDAAQSASENLSTALTGRTYVTASAGNHGLSVAVGAKIFGANAVIYLADTVPEAFVEKLRSKDASVIREGVDYEHSMKAAKKAAEDNEWTLLSDSSWPGYFETPHRLMEGYLVMAAEITRQIPLPPTHIFLQAGVGGLASACAAWFRKVWGDAPQILVVEPDNAPALYESIAVGRPVETAGPVSCMGRLDCKEPSLIALNGLSRDADFFVLISDCEAESVLPTLSQAGLSCTTSAAAGVAALSLMDLPKGSRALCILSEAA